MPNMDPLIWISLFGLGIGAAALAFAEISSRRYDRKYGSRKG